MFDSDAFESTLSPAHAELSLNTGEGESSMSLLIQKQMTNILAPLAARVLDLEESARQHTHGLVVSSERADKAENRLDLHDRKLSALFSDLLKTNEEVRGAHSALMEHGELHDALHNDHKGTRALASQQELQLKGAHAALAELHRSREDLDERVRELQRTMADTNVSHVNINDKVAELRNRSEGLYDRHTELVTTVQDAKHSDENTRQAIKRLTMIFEKQRREDAKAFSASDDRLKATEGGVTETNQRLEVVMKALKSAKSDIAQVKQAVDNVVGHQTGANPSLTLPQLGQIQERIDRMEEGLSNLFRTSSSDRQQWTGFLQPLRDSISKNAADITKNASDLNTLDRKLKATGSRLQHTEQLVNSLGDKQDKHKEQFDTSNDGLKSAIHSVERSIANKLDLQGRDLASTAASLQHTTQRLDMTSAGLQNLSTDVSNTNGHVSKMGQSLDLAHEYFHGLSRGLQDTHKKVVTGPDGILNASAMRPKSARGRPLPLQPHPLDHTM